MSSSSALIMKSMLISDAPWLIMRMLMWLSAKVRLAAAATPTFYRMASPTMAKMQRSSSTWMESGLSLS